MYSDRSPDAAQNCTMLYLNRQLTAAGKRQTTDRRFTSKKSSSIISARDATPLNWNHLKRTTRRPAMGELAALASEENFFYLSLFSWLLLHDLTTLSPQWWSGRSTTAYIMLDLRSLTWELWRKPKAVRLLIASPHNQPMYPKMCSIDIFLNLQPVG